ncbi:MAG TPA: carbohydrate kinase family protein, partial [Clostridia bacterium]|nr:carbohydrate kinase family protein [Clostridia bacterium]
MKDYVCVIGGANIDISSTSFAPLIKYDSNPSKTTLSLGGVGRNVAENLARLGVKTKFLTAFGNDIYAEKIQLSCKELGIDTKDSLTTICPTSTYLCINDNNGDMYIAASDMEILNLINEDFLRSKMDVLNNAQAVAIDTNLSPQAIDFVLKNCKAPVFIETVSVNKTKKLHGLGGAHTIKPNVYEAQEITGIKIKKQKDLQKAAEILHKNGYKNVVITLGEKGAFYSNNKTVGLVWEKADKIVNTTGAGDSFFAALLWAYV